MPTGRSTSWPGMPAAAPHEKKRRSAACSARRKKTCSACLRLGRAADYFPPRPHTNKHGVQGRPERQAGKKGALGLWYAWLVSLLAGLFTALGGAFALLTPPGETAIAAGMGFAGGVMVTVSLGDLLPEAFAVYRQTAGAFAAAGKTLSLFCLGAAAALLLAACLPEEAELLARRGRRQAAPAGEGTLQAAALRSALVTTAVVVLHNLPEGVLTLFTSYADRRMGLTVALAIGLHNFPEGIVIAAPVLYATGRRGRAFAAAAFSGLAEPFGAALAFLCLRRVLNRLFLNGLLCVVAGMMCAVSWFELLALGFRTGRGRACAWGALVGCALMSFGIYCIP